MTANLYHYRENGLDDVYLESGFRFVEDDRRRVVVIDDIDGLHRAIGRHLVEDTRRLTGAEFRFLRVELGLSQAALARLMDVSEQSVARWEKGQARVDPAADRLLRLLYAEKVGGAAQVGERLGRLAQLDAERGHEIVFAGTRAGWAPLPRAA